MANRRTSHLPAFRSKPAPRRQPTVREVSGRGGTTILRIGPEFHGLGGNKKNATPAIRWIERDTYQSLNDNDKE